MFEDPSDLTDYESNEILGDGGAGCPAVVAVHVDVEPLIGGDHRVLDCLLLGPDQRQHSPDTKHGVQQTELKGTHKEVNCLEEQIKTKLKIKFSHLEDVRILFGAEQLSDHGQTLVDYLGELQRVLQELDQQFLFVELVLAKYISANLHLAFFLQPGSDAVTGSENRPENKRT